MRIRNYYYYLSQFDSFEKSYFKRNFSSILQEKFLIVKSFKLSNLMFQFKFYLESLFFVLVPRFCLTKFSYSLRNIFYFFELFLTFFSLQKNKIPQSQPLWGFKTQITRKLNITNLCLKNQINILLNFLAKILFYYFLK